VPQRKELNEDNPE